MYLWSCKIYIFFFPPSQLCWALKFVMGEWYLSSLLSVSQHTRWEYVTTPCRKLFLVSLQVLELVGWKACRRTWSRLTREYLISIRPKDNTPQYHKTRPINKFYPLCLFPRCLLLIPFAKFSLRTFVYSMSCILYCLVLRISKANGIYCRLGSCCRFSLLRSFRVDSLTA